MLTQHVVTNLLKSTVDMLRINENLGIDAFHHDKNHSKHKPTKSTLAQSMEALDKSIERLNLDFLVLKTKSFLEKTTKIITLHANNLNNDTL